MKISYNRYNKINHTNSFNNTNQKVVFKGISLGDFNSGDQFEYANSGISENDDIAKKFEERLKNIKDTCSQKKKQVTGFFKKRKIAKIQKETDDRISGFLSAQEAALETQSKVVELLEEKCELLKKNNVDKAQLEEAKKVLLIATRIKQERAELIANKKSRHKGFDSIAGYEKEKFILTDSFINLLPLEAAGQDVEFPNSILFFGPIGNGKTSFAKAFANSANCNFVEAKSSRTARSKGDREKSFYDNLLSNANIAQQNFLDTGKRTIILVDEIDRFAYEGSSINAKLKKFLEVCSKDYHCTVFATTNNPLEIPSAIRGPKRMPIKVCIDPPDETNTALVFEHYLKDCENIDTSKIDFYELAEVLCSVQPERAYNNSQIESICNECIESSDVITQEDLIYHIKRETPGIDRESMAKYKEEKELLVGDDE